MGRTQTRQLYVLYRGLNVAKTLEEIRQLAIDNEVKGKKFSTMAKLLNNIQIEKHDGSNYKIYKNKQKQN